MPKPVTLGTALSFNADDLAANKEGRLGKHQLRAARSTSAIWSGMGLLFVVAMVAATKAQSDREGHSTAAVVLPGVLAALVGGFCLLLGVQIWRGRTAKTPVRKVTGVVQLRNGRAYYVGETRFLGKGVSASHQTDPLPRLLKGDPVCDVYLVRNQAVSIERSDGLSGPQ